MVEMRTIESRRLFREAKLAERRGDIKATAEFNRQGLLLDSRASQADWDLLEESPRLFRERRALYALLSIRVEDMARAVYAESKLAKAAPTVQPHTFMYWGQGFDSAPPIVQACYAQAVRLHDHDEIIFLDNNNLHDWVTLPPAVMEISQSKRAAFSDVLRFELLAKYGGIWMDATCLPTRRLHDAYPDMVRSSGFYAFGKGKPGLISSWFLASEAGNYITCMTRDALRLYFGVYDQPIMYFFLHQMFMYLHRLDERFGKLWDKSTVLPVDPRALNRALLKEVSDVDLSSLIAGSFVHKLTHKHNSEIVTASSVQQVLIDRFTARASH